MLFELKLFLKHSELMVFEGEEMKIGFENIQLIFSDIVVGSYVFKVIESVSEVRF